jgi:hypothetical protein
MRVGGDHHLTRRVVLATIAAAGLSAPPAHADLAAFEWSGLWRGAPADDRPKQTGLPVGEIAKIIEADLAGNKYILTGVLTPSIFAESCRFVDPNNAVDGLNKYRQAVSLLFRPDESTVSNVVVSVGSDGKSVEADYVARGVLKLPWKPVISSWSGHIVYTLDSAGLIASQVDACAHGTVRTEPNEALVP